MVVIKREKRGKIKYIKREKRGKIERDGSHKEREEREERQMVDIKRET
jgi:hypothetical protein